MPETKKIIKESTLVQWPPLVKFVHGFKLAPGSEVHTGCISIGNCSQNCILTAQGVPNAYFFCKMFVLRYLDPKTVSLIFC